VRCSRKAARSHLAALGLVQTAGIGNNPTHQAAQNHLATLSTDIAHRTIEGASHEGLVGEEASAAHTTAAILDVVQAVRSHAPVRR
jgi:hypothetical protein